MTGSGTFENYVSIAAGCRATPNGRLNGQPFSSDCSQQSYPQVYCTRLSACLQHNAMASSDPTIHEVPPEDKKLDIIDTLKPYTLQSTSNIHMTAFICTAYLNVYRDDLDTPCM